MSGAAATGVPATETNATKMSAATASQVAAGAAAPDAAPAPAPGPTQSVAFKKKSRKKKRGGKIRRMTSKNGSSSEDESTIVHATTKRKRTVNTFGSTVRKSKATSANAVDSLLEKSDRSTTAVQYSGGATAIAEFDTAVDNDERAIRERNIALNESGAADDATTYRGAAGYKNYIKKDKEQLAANKFTGTQGPIRPSVFFRPSFRMDYQPDVCKDYKDTGFCGYGDTCKFMHDRGNYKQGWQIEQDFQEAEKKRKALLNGETVEEGPDFSSKKKRDAEELPFACIICRQKFTDPVETKCGHYFCEDCALERYRADTTCAACGKETRGAFNRARKIIERMEAEEREFAQKNSVAI